jgi:amidase
MFRSAVELAGLVRDGSVSARELVTESLARIEALEPQVGAFTFVAAEEALKEAAAVGAGDGRPFAGVPIAIKDNRAVAGMPLTFGSDLFGDLVAHEDAFLVRRLRDAGFIVVGKTRLPEMGFLPTCEPRRFGPTRNPWDLSVTPGGSSGGAAAAVAAGMVPLAHGNDGGGSIRIPAACCGLFGLKPARGRISVGPTAGQSFLTEDGVLTRTVADSAAVLDVLAGYEPGDATWAPPPSAPFASVSAPGRLRVGFTLTPALEGAVLHPLAEAAAREAAGLLAELGHEVEEISPGWDRPNLLASFAAVFTAQGSTLAEVGWRRRGIAPGPELVEELTWLLYERARELGAVQYLGLQNRLERIAREIIAGLVPYDIVLTPALAGRPPAIGEMHGRGPDALEHFRRSGAFTPYTGIVNMMGRPAAAVPFAQGEDGLPVAVQLIGPPAREDVVLALAAQLEAARPWAGWRPPVS